MRYLDVCNFSAVSAYNVGTLRPELRELCWTAIRCVPRYLDFAVTVGHRNQADQERAFRAGLSEKHWPDGEHNAIPSNAFDFRPASPFSAEDWADHVRFARIAGYFEALAVQLQHPIRLGLDWDGDGRSSDEKLLDLGHVEWAGVGR